jgi:hypothetical protein
LAAPQRGQTLREGAARFQAPARRLRVFDFDFFFLGTAMVTPDNGEKFAIEMSNSTLTSIKGQLAKNPDLSVALNRSDLETVMGGKTTFDALIAAGKAKFEGNRKPFDQLRSTLVQFTPDFELMPGTKPVKAVPPPATKDPFEVIQSDTKGVP